MKYVIAVSGGVDSIVLLDALVRGRLAELGSSVQPPGVSEQSEFVVAHFDHGIREDSWTDEEFARGVAGEYGLEFVSEAGELGPHTSEDKARQARYTFLREVCKMYNAQLITAHHQDDLLETMVINLLRGTGWRGLASMEQFSIFNFQYSNFKQTPLRHSSRGVESRKNIQNKPWILNQVQYDAGNMAILRPLLGTSKAQILAYARKYRLEWREDSTNKDQNYLRNYVRLTLLPRLYQQNPQAHNQLVAINQTTTRLKKEIATELQKLSPMVESRYFLIMAPPLVAQELLYSRLTQLDPTWHPTKLQLVRVLHFIKTADTSKQYEVSKRLLVVVDRRRIQFKKR